MRTTDYNGYSGNKTAAQKKKEEQERVIRADIDAIDLALATGVESKMREVHIMLDGKYSSYVPNWGMSTYRYNLRHGYDYDCFSKSELTHNLSVFKAKLSGYLCDFDVREQDTVAENNINVNVNNVNEINQNISFDEARKKIEDMPGLDDAATEEIKAKIDELENIAKENISKKKKWEKVKPILAFVMDKGADAAIAIMTLVLQMKLGM